MPKAASDTRPPRGHRSTKKQSERNARYVANKNTLREVAESHTTTLTPQQSLPNTFYRVRSEPALVSQYIRNTFGASPPTLPVFAGAERATENLRIFCAATEEDEQGLGPGGVHQSWTGVLTPAVRRWLAAQERNYLYAARFVDQVSSDTEREIYGTWGKIQDIGLVLDHKNDNRSGTPAAHFGLWQTPGNPLAIAGDGKQLLDRVRGRDRVLVEKLQNLIQHFMRLLKRFVVQKIDKILEREFPIMKKLKPVCGILFLRLLFVNSDA
uniref:Uncharacterized protein n=1 Tax=Mycena chlorophos TaxID=658473 RepID=A0ABQ0L1D3_MYCCL|nr:predicted protein [Mycena chlorophos]